jgi:hypothetical protein
MPSKGAQLQQGRDTLDPFELSQRIEQKLERIFQLSSQTGSTTVTVFHNHSQKEKRSQKERMKAATTILGYILFCSMIPLKVTFLNCVTGAGTGTFDNIRFSGRANQQNAIRYDGVEGSAVIDASVTSVAPASSTTA